MTEKSEETQTGAGEPQDQLLTLSEVSRRVSLSGSTIRRYCKAVGPDGRPCFPPPLVLGRGAGKKGGGPQAYRWLASEISAWIRERANERTATGPVVS